MARGYAMFSATKKYAGWYGHKQDFPLKNFPPEVVFILSDERDPLVPPLKAERDAPQPPSPPPVIDDLLILAQKGSTPQELIDAQLRIDNRPKPGGP